MDFQLILLEECSKAAGNQTDSQAETNRGNSDGVDASSLRIQKLILALVDGLSLAAPEFIVADIELEDGVNAICCLAGGNCS